MAQEETPLHLRAQSHPPPDQDCDDAQKIVITPVYRGRLEESHERTRRAWRRRTWYQVTYTRVTRNVNDFAENHSQAIFTIVTYMIGAVILMTIIAAVARVLFNSRGSKWKSQTGHGHSGTASRGGSAPLQHAQ